MSRLTGTVLLLIAGAFLLPTITRAAWAAVPYLVGLLIVLAIVRMALPPRPRRW